MTKNIRLLLAICLLAITGVIVLQFYWARNYYKVTRFNFEREVNLAYEDAVKKEFELRCDTIQQLVVEHLMDTSAFIITSKYFNSFGYFSHTITNAKDKKDLTSFSHADLPDSLTPDDTAYKRKIAGLYAKNLRNEDLENHLVFYRTQNLGQFLTDKVREYGFDTNRLRPVLQEYLNKRNIHTSFSFYTTDSDSLLNHIKVPDSLVNKGAVITKSYPTRKWWVASEQYVRAVFDNPVGYIISQMKWVLGGSLLLIVLVGLSIGLLVKALLREKRLSIIKNDFINNITHELKTPVATVSAAVEALQDLGLPGEKTNRYLGHAQNEMARLAKLVDSILDSSLYEKSLPVHPEPIVVEETLNTIVERLKIAADKPVQYTYTSDATTNTISADKLLFHQALTNVLDNAIKYSGTEARITIHCYSQEKYFHIKCRDEGEGIAASSLPHIFEKFYREPKSHHAVKGYGLGLNYVQHIMKAHRGKVELTSIKSKGTTVILSWPL